MKQKAHNANTMTTDTPVMSPTQKSPGHHCSESLILQTTGQGGDDLHGAGKTAKAKLKWDGLVFGGFPWFGSASPVKHVTEPVYLPQGSTVTSDLTRSGDTLFTWSTWFLFCLPCYRSYITADWREAGEVFLTRGRFNSSLETFCLQHEVRSWLMGLFL